VKLLKQFDRSVHNRKVGITTHDYQYPWFHVFSL
jgi:hypothetical protein